jgi:hypothetical protein
MGKIQNATDLGGVGRRKAAFVVLLELFGCVLPTHLDFESTVRFTESNYCLR